MAPDLTTALALLRASGWACSAAAAAAAASTSSLLLLHEQQMLACLHCLLCHLYCYCIDI
jgi:ABC-type transport system involved in cytochrome bd biosynthesis fused ATPase/permease subunit